MNSRRFTVQGATIMSDSLMKSVAGNWIVWRERIEEYLGSQPSGDRIFDLGSELSDIWRIKDSKRGQSGVAIAGYSWEFLVSWYLNLVLWDTGIISTRYKNKFVPQVIQDALTVQMGNFVGHSESDVIIYGLPKGVSDKLPISALNKDISGRIGELDVTVLQLKTSWAEQAQIPMLWDLLYRHSGVSNLADVNIGVRGSAPHYFRTFNYAFATVPTQKKLPKAGMTNVKRVENLSGGNYWGRPTQSGVALSLTEFFNRNFRQRLEVSPQTIIQNNLDSDPDYLERFLRLDFS